MSIFADSLERLPRNLHGPIDTAIGLSGQLVTYRNRIRTRSTIENDVDVRRLVLNMDELDAIHDCDVSSRGEEYANGSDDYSTPCGEVNLLVVFQVLLDLLISIEFVH